MISGKLDSPQEFGRYTLTAKVAAGGMATVYLAHVQPGDELEGRPIAIKILHDHLSDNPEFVRMFKDEGRIVRDLDHPNVVRVYDVGEHAGQHYLAMEYIDGRDLGQVLLAHRLNHIQVPSPVAFEILRQALVALRYVHDFKGRFGKSQGIVHRDVSPQNLLISREPLIKLTDFGIARGEHRSDKTRTGTIKGKMHYMAPEQASGERVDARADLYAMGAVAYEMLTSQPLFGPGTTEVLHMRAMRGEFDYGPKFERLPEDVKTWLKRSLSALPEMRFQSADAMLAAMEQLHKASRSSYRPEVLVKLLDMEDARRSKQKAKNQRLILEDAASCGRLQPGAILQAGALPPKVVPTGARVELDGNQRVSRLGHERGDAKVDWSQKPSVEMRPVTAVRDMAARVERVHARRDLLPVEVATGRTYPAESHAAGAGAVETLTPGSLSAPRAHVDESQAAPVVARPKARPAAAPLQEQPGLALASAVAWSCAALLLFAVTQELIGAQVKVPEAQDLAVASLWEDGPQPTRTDAVARSAPRPKRTAREVAPQTLRASAAVATPVLGAPGSAPAVSPTRKIAGGLVPVLPAAAEDPQRAEARAQFAVARNVERVAWEGRPVERVERPGVPERGEEGAKPAKPAPIKPVTLTEARAAVEAAAHLCTAIAGMPGTPAKAKRAVPADRASPVLVAAKAPVVPKPAPRPAVAAMPAAPAKPVVAAKPVAAKPAVAAKPVATAKPVAAAKPAVAAKPAAAPAKPVAAPIKAAGAPAKPLAPVAPKAPLAAKSSPGPGAAAAHSTARAAGQPPVGAPKSAPAVAK